MSRDAASMVGRGPARPARRAQERVGHEREDERREILQGAPTGLPPQTPRPAGRLTDQRLPPAPRPPGRQCPRERRDGAAARRAPRSEGLPYLARRSGRRLLPLYHSCIQYNVLRYSLLTWCVGAARAVRSACGPPAPRRPAGICWCAGGAAATARRPALRILQLLCMCLCLWYLIC